MFENFLGPNSRAGPNTRRFNLTIFFTPPLGDYGDGYCEISAFAVCTIRAGRGRRSISKNCRPMLEGCLGCKSKQQQGDTNIRPGIVVDTYYIDTRRIARRGGISPTAMLS